MKPIIAIVMSLILMMGLTSCSTNDENAAPVHEGYIFQKDGNRVLVLDAVKEEDKGKSWNDIFDHYQGRAIWLKTDDIAKLEVGQMVRYWIDGPVAESYPEQGAAKKIEVIQE